MPALVILVGARVRDLSPVEVAPTNYSLKLTRETIHVCPIECPGVLPYWVNELTRRNIYETAELKEVVETGYAWINRGPWTGIKREPLSARAIWIMILAICTMLFVG